MNKFQLNLDFDQLYARFETIFHGTFLDYSLQQKQQKATITSLISGGKRRLVYVFEDGREMVEQYDKDTHLLLLRKTKKPNHFKQAQWTFQVGQPYEKKKQQEAIMIKTNNAPIFLRSDKFECFQWRIRNLAYPADNYILEVDSEKQEIVIKTTVKKYYKRFDVPEMKRANIKLDKENLSFTHTNMTLIVSYKKPELILEREYKMRKEFEKLNLKKPKQGDIECNIQ